MTGGSRCRECWPPFCLNGWLSQFGRGGPDIGDMFALSGMATDRVKEPGKFVVNNECQKNMCSKAALSDPYIIERQPHWDEYMDE